MYISIREKKRKQVRSKSYDFFPLGNRRRKKDFLKYSFFVFNIGTCILVAQCEKCLEYCQPDSANLPKFGESFA